MKKILFALCLLLFVSCTRDVVLVLPPVSPRLVLNASVSPDTDVTAFLSKSWFVLDTVTDDGVEDGSIQVFINDRLQGRMQPVSDSRFTGRYVLPGCRVRAGDRLRCVFSSVLFIAFAVKKSKHTVNIDTTYA